MFKTLLGYIREIRQRRADFKAANRGSLNFTKMLKEAQEERNQLWDNPPPCGSVIRYVHESVYEETYGEFLFSASDIEEKLKDIIQELPNLAESDEGAILNWIKQRDESLDEPTDVPSIWSRFKYVANDLVRAGKADMYCMQCEATYGIGQCATKDDQGKPGYNFDRLLCPEGHLLLMVDTVHLMMK